MNHRQYIGAALEKLSSLEDAMPRCDVYGCMRPAVVVVANGAAFFCTECATESIPLAADWLPYGEALASAIAFLDSLESHR